MNDQFKAGMYVYFPMFTDGKMCKLVNNASREYPLRIKLGNTMSYALTTDGKLYKDHRNPSIFEATEQNCILLSNLYGFEFEPPPAPNHITMNAVYGGEWEKPAQEAVKPKTKRKVIRLETYLNYYTAICDDGSLWVMNKKFGNWEQLSSIPQDFPKNMEAYENNLNELLKK